MTPVEAYWAGYQAGKLSMPEIVRCKDCKHRTRKVCGNLEFWECEHLRYEKTKVGVTDEWYCADGERRDADA